MIRSRRLAATILVAALAFAGGTYYGHERTNCGDVMHQQTTRHECWMVHHTDDK